MRHGAGIVASGDAEIPDPDRRGNGRQRQQCHASAEHVPYAIHTAPSARATVSFGPFSTAIVEASNQRRLDDFEIRRNVKVPWHEQAVMPNLEYLGAAAGAFRAIGGTAGDMRQNRITHGLEALRNQGRADGPGRIAAAQGQQAASPALTEPVASESGNGRDRRHLQIVPITDAPAGVVDEAPTIVVRQPDRATDPAMRALEDGKADSANPVDDIGLDEAQGSTVLVAFPRYRRRKARRATRCTRVRYLIAVLKRLLPSTSSTSPGCNVVASRVMSVAGDELQVCAWPLSQRASLPPIHCPTGPRLACQPLTAGRRLSLSFQS